MKHTIFLVVFAAVGAIVMLLWNLLLPSIFGFASINYWQSLGLLLLSTLLFGGFSKMPFAFYGHHGHFGSMGKSSRKEFFEMHEKARKMSPEERAEFIRKRMESRANEGE